MRSRNTLTIAADDPLMPVRRSRAFIRELWPGSLGATLKVWYRADSLALNDDDAMSTWADQSGSGSDATQGTAANQPSYQTAEANALPAVQFDGTNDWMSASGTDVQFGNTSEFTITAVVKQNGAGADGTGGTILGSYSGGNGFLFYIYASSTGVYWQSNGSGFSTGVALSAGWHILTFQRTSTSDVIYVDGAQAALRARGTLAASGAALYLGRYSASDSQYWKGWTGEMLVCNTTLPRCQMFGIELYLARKYGLRIS